ncbi:hypothetical protein HY312_01070, partial [Candidatus Saccharibacteria bacterium]|nr:hypothetical protein [Candidatus Saccharibacteria bacterium]
ILFMGIVASVIFIQSGIVDALIVFLLSGAVPGTSIVVSPTAMMIGLATVTWLVLTQITALGTLNLMTMRRLVKRYGKKQDRMPKRRYSRI